MNGAAGIILMAVVSVIMLRGAICRCDAYGAFLRGAERGMCSAASLLPALCAMLLMLSVFRSSGAAGLLTRLLAPVTSLLHLPEETVPILLLRPLTGSGSLAALQEVFVQCGPDSRAGMIASVLVGSSETIFYTMTVYLGAAGVRRLPWAIPVSLVASLAGAAVCGLIL
ncbi:MAG: spore maturation protein [Clostridiales bacterium]|nr:spore maturation protein [Clostridiales bacterium]